MSQSLGAVEAEKVELHGACEVAEPTYLIFLKRTQRQGGCDCPEVFDRSDAWAKAGWHPGKSHPGGASVFLPSDTTRALLRQGQSFL